jgi:hypothetical protein
MVRLVTDIITIPTKIRERRKGYEEFKDDG